MKVSQEARDFAATIEEAYYDQRPDFSVIAATIKGDFDHAPLLQLIAAFEQSIRDKALEEAAAVVEARKAGYGSYESDQNDAELDEIAAAIRQMKGEG